MRAVFTSLLVLLAGVVYAQNCQQPYHSTHAQDQWLSCTPAPNPNSVRGVSHWILYDLGEVYTLSTSRFWNYNVAGETERGIRRGSIDYSLDGQTWQPASEFTLAEAPGTPQYAGERGPDFGEIEARYVLVTAVESWGNDCSGLAEVRFDVVGKTAEPQVPVELGEIRLYPNPTRETLYLKTDLAVESIVVLNTTGAVVARMPFSTEIETRFLPTGIYYIQFFLEGGQTTSSTFLKQGL